MTDFLLSIKGIVDPNVSVSEAPDARRAIPEQPTVTSGDIVPPSPALDNFDGLKGISSAITVLLDDLRASGIVTNPKIKSELDKYLGDSIVATPLRTEGSFQDPDEPVSTTGTMLDAAPMPTDSYVIKSGDTMGKIAANNPFTLNQLIASNPQIEDPNKIEVGQQLNFPPVGVAKAGQIPVEEEAVQIPSVTAEQRTALSDLGSDVNRVNLEKITNARGNYSPQALTNAIDRGIRNTNKKALLKGASQTEIGNRGLVREGTRFSLRRAYEVYDDRIVNDALQSLPQAEQNRINRGEASDALGIAIHDRAYDGGSNYAGRGLIQLTHRRNYQAVQTILENDGINIDLVNNPDLANDTRYALPISIAYLQHAGLTDEAASNSSARDLQSRINPNIGTDVAEERWGNVIQALRDAGEDDEANRFEKRNEYAAQRRVGFRGNDIDGIIGTDSDREMRRWLTGRSVNIPANATGMDLVVLVNSQP